MIPHRSVPVPPPTHDPKAVLTSAVKLAALVGTTCVVVGLVTAIALIGLIVELQR